MTKDKKRGSRKKTGNSPSPRPPTKRGDIEGQPDTQPKANDCRYVKQDPPDVYVNIPPPEKKEWNLANKIALGVGIVTTALTVFTYLLFVKAGVQAEQAVRTANSADSVFAVTQHEWQIENEPYLQIMQPKIESFIGGQPITFTYFFVNLGKYPARILTLDVGGKANTYPPNVEDSSTFKEIGGIPDFINTVIIKESPLTLDRPAIDTRPLNESKYFGVINHTYNYYFYGRIQYQNLANSESRIYTFLVQLDPITKAAHYLYNENKDVSTPK